MKFKNFVGIEKKGLKFVGIGKNAKIFGEWGK